MRHLFKKKNIFVAAIVTILLFGCLRNVNAQVDQTAQQDIGSGASANSASGVNQPYTLLSPLPCNAGLGGASCSTDSNGNSVVTSITLSQFVSYAYKFLLALAVVLAVFMITVGGFEYMLNGAANSKGDAIKKIQGAVLGLILALVAYLLLYTIDPNLVSQNNLTIPPITYSSAFTTPNGLAAALQLPRAMGARILAKAIQITPQSARKPIV
jgi:hypothetical protein